MTQLYSGPQLRELRCTRGLSQRAMAESLGISVSYLSQIESGDRPITPKVLAKLAQSLPTDWASVDPAGDAALLLLAIQASSDPSIRHPIQADTALRRTMTRHPSIAKRMVALHEAVGQLQDQLRALDDRVGSTATGAHDRRSLPWDEAREWFHTKRNYVDEIDRAAEAIGGELGTGSLAPGVAVRLQQRHGVAVLADDALGRTIRRYDPDTRTIRIDPHQAAETTAFSLAHLLARLELSHISNDLLIYQDVSDDAKQLIEAGLANYAAAAILMPYRRFRESAREVRHDIDRLRHRFGTSFEQTCHRLSTLQRPGSEGIPFFFCRVDMAGNITKRHSATRLQFARFGGACPLWIVHEAAAVPDRILVQLAETPDGTRYISMAKGLVKPSGSYSRAPRRYAVALGCEFEHAADFVYANGVMAEGSVAPIGSSCRTCPRAGCEQRAFPPSTAVIRIEHEYRGVVPYQFD